METWFCKIKVTEVVDPHSFTAQVGTDEMFKKLEMNEEMCREYCENAQRCDETDELEYGLMVLVYSEHWEKWIRAKVSMITEDQDVDVVCIDYGTTEIIEVKNIVVNLPSYLADFFDEAKSPPYAMKCKLSGVLPIASTFTRRAVDVFAAQVFMQVADCEVDTMNEGILDVEILVEEDVGIKSVAEILIEAGVAQPALDSPRQSPDKGNKVVVPSFNLQQLMAPEKSTKPVEETESSEEEDIEQQLFKSGYEENDNSEWDFRRGKRYTRESNRPMSAQPWSKNTSRPVGNHTKGSPKAESNGHHMTGVLQGNRDSSASPVPRGRGRGRRYNNDGITPPSSRDVSPYPGSSTNSPKTGTTNKKSVGANKSKADSHNNSAESFPSPKLNVENQASSSNPEMRNSRNTNNAMRSWAVKSNPEKLKNEYEWQSHKISRNMKQILSKMESTGDILLDEVVALAIPVHSKLVDLPGPKELFICLDTVISYAIENIDYIDKALAVMEVLTISPLFADCLSELLWKHQTEHILSSNVIGGEKCENYCHLLGCLYIQASQWEPAASHPVNVCVVNTMEKWTDFHGKQMTTEKQELLVSCLHQLLSIAGVEIQIQRPTEMARILDQIKENVLDEKVSRSVKTSLLEVMMNQSNCWRPFQPLGEITQCKEMKKLRDLEPDEGEVPPGGEWLPRQTLPVQTSDAAINTSLNNEYLKYAEVQVDEKELMLCSGEGAEGSQVRSDPYILVKEMIQELQLDNALPMFEENAIRDKTLCSMKFEDLKELLKECHFKTGVIYEIKAYLAELKTRTGGRIESQITSKTGPDSSAKLCIDQVEHLRLITPSAKGFTQSPVPNTGSNRNDELPLLDGSSKVTNGSVPETILADKTDAIFEGRRPKMSVNKRAFKNILANCVDQNNHQEHSSWQNKRAPETSHEVPSLADRNEDVVKDTRPLPWQPAKKPTDQREVTSYPSNLNARETDSQVGSVIILDDSEDADDEEEDFIYGNEEISMSREPVPRHTKRNFTVASYIAEASQNTNEAEPQTRPFASSARVCLICGDKNHISYYCPDKSSKFLLND